ncbi:MAG: hypothetical protein M3Z05_08980 [Gemmatimonadota bacterium]|nr:hypothetical protein [Gemmatimonadota bacterium]
MPPKIARLAGLGAFGVCAGIAAIFALFVYITRPTGSSGLDSPERFLALFTVAGVLVALAVVHVAIGNQLMALAKGESRRA